MALLLFCEISAGFVGIFVLYQIGVGQHLGVAFDRGLALANLLSDSGFLDAGVGLDEMKYLQGNAFFRAIYRTIYRAILVSALSGEVRFQRLLEADGQSDEVRDGLKFRSGKTLLRIFPTKAHDLGQRAVYNELQAIKDFRNSIAHHEAICFDDTGARNTQPARDKYAMVLKYVKYLGYPESHLYYGLDILPDKILQKIDTL